MPAICLYFQVHQPCRLKRYTAFDIGHDHDYEDREENRRLLEKVAERCYLPANALLSNLIRKHEGRFRVAFSISGVLLDQLTTYRPDVLESFQRLAETGCVEFLNETYYHSLSFLFSRDEFRAQVSRHRRKIKELFGQDGKTFRFTELIYNNDLAREAESLGYEVILAEGAEALLDDRSPNRVYRASWDGAGDGRIKLLLRNYRLSDDVSFRFSNRGWQEYPLTVGKYAHWIHGENGAGTVINLFMDYETFGEHQWADTGIFRFLEKLPGGILKHRDFVFATPAEIAGTVESVDSIDAPELSSWADTERDLTAWLGNAMQQDAAGTLYGLEATVKACKDTILLDSWRKLQTSDHFYYMCTKWFADGDVHKYFNPYPSPYDAYINYMNILDDLSKQVKKEKRS
ncbi:MAG: glycoside hydrolase family 57 protein [Deltaproteobacteria bacterium]|nr:glycoside hydrolase family 57 protein [Deltaproteobacteria bacterium]